MKTYPKQGQNLYNFARRADLRNFLRQTFKPSASKKALKPFPLIMDDKYYVALPLDGQMASRSAIKMTTMPVSILVDDPDRPGKKTRVHLDMKDHDSAKYLKWKTNRGEDYLYRFVRNAAEAKRVMEEILDAGIEISNYDYMLARAREMRMVMKRKLTPMGRL